MASIILTGIITILLIGVGYIPNKHDLREYQLSTGKHMWTMAGKVFLSLVALVVVLTIVACGIQYNDVKNSNIAEVKAKTELNKKLAEIQFVQGKCDSMQGVSQSKIDSLEGKFDRKRFDKPILDLYEGILNPIHIKGNGFDTFRISITLAKGYAATNIQDRCLLVLYKNGEIEVFSYGVWQPWAKGIPLYEGRYMSYEITTLHSQVEKYDSIMYAVYEVKYANNSGVIQPIFRYIFPIYKNYGAIPATLNSISYQIESFLIKNKIST